MEENPPKKRNHDDTTVAFGTDVTKAKFNQVLLAHRATGLYLEKAKNYLTKRKTSNGVIMPLYNTWFGKYSRKNYEHVRDNFVETFAENEKPHVFNFLPQSMCKPDWTAYVDSPLLGKKQHIINLCDKFFEDDHQEQTITLIHEMTHDSSATHDVCDDCYGTDNCQTMATMNPNLAIENADNYALFAKDVFLLKPKGNKHKLEHTNSNPYPPKKLKSKTKIKPGVTRSEKLLFKLFQLVMAQ